MGSHNLSRAAWGELQKQQSSLFIRSYELGVLCLPALEAQYRQHPHRGFSCTAPEAAGGVQPLLRCPRRALPPRCRGAAAAAAPRLQRTRSDVSTGQYGRWSGLGEPSCQPGERKVHRGVLYQSSGSLIDLSSGGDGPDAGRASTSAPATASVTISTGSAEAGGLSTNPPLTTADPPAAKRVVFVIAGRDTAAGEAAAAAAAPDVEYVPLPLPYALPPRPYGGADVPWTVDEEASALLVDTYGLRRDEAVGGMYGYVQDTVQPYFQDNN